MADVPPVAPAQHPNAEAPAVPLPDPVVVTTTPTVDENDPDVTPITDPDTDPDVDPDPDPEPEPEPEPDPDPGVTPPPPASFSYTGALSAVWASEGGDKVAQEELRAQADPSSVTNAVWDGEQIAIFGGRNEVVHFLLTLEAATSAVPNIAVALPTLIGPDDFTLQSTNATGSNLFRWLNRHIELFFIRYLEIKGLSSFCCNFYDERHIPKRLRRPHDDNGVGTGVWTDRPDHNTHYPDIAVPLELHPTFSVASGTNQGLWVDIYVPKEAPAGSYDGTLTIQENGVVTGTVPVRLQVRNFTLPDTPTAKTMLYLGYADINHRYLGEKFPYAPELVAQSRDIINRHYQLAHRHKLSLIDSDSDNDPWDEDAPRPTWWPRLDGSLFSAAQGYDGPGSGVGNNVYAIAPYGNWGWKCLPEGETPCTWTPHAWTEAEMRTHSDGWVNWFSANAPTVDYFLYLIDESDDYAQIETWASWLNNNPGPGQQLRSLATTAAPTAQAEMPALDLPTSGMYVGDTIPWQTAADYYQSTPGKQFFMYNGGRPSAGSFMTEDDGVALRVTAWAQYKKHIARWFYWESTYYNNFQAGEGETNVFQQAKTFGGTSGVDEVVGETGWNHSNGDGLLFYPGTDRVYPAESYEVPGPFASLRLKYWRRGIQDVDYLVLAKSTHPECSAAVDDIVATIIPKVLWDNGVSDPNDPTWVRTDISWSTDPDDWEAARGELANIIESGCAP